MPAVAPSLPGIYFLSEPPVLAETLPRMDVALLVGFAASGPINVPVPIQDVDYFLDIFGGGRGNFTKVELAWDATSKTIERAHLESAVRLLFRNGGQRCWIIRVAGKCAKSNKFVLPGLSRSSDFQSAELSARSEGSWSDLLQVSTVRRSQSLPFRRGDLAGRQLVLAKDASVVAGDLCQLRWDATVGYVVVKEVSREDLELVVSWEVEEERWFERLGEESSGSGNTELVVASAPQDLPATSPSGTGAVLVERLAFDLLVWRERELLGRMDNLAFSSRHPRFWEQLPTDFELFRPSVNCEEPAQADELLRELRESSEPRFALAGSRPPIPGPNEAGHWFYLPVSPPGSLDSSSPPARGLLMPVIARAEEKVGRKIEAAESDPLERSGLGQFGAELFLDSELASEFTHTLAATAEAKASLRNRPELLEGLHALLGLEEVTLVAVPDAVHRGWERGGVEVDDNVFPAPVLNPVSILKQSYVVAWSVVGKAQAYALEESSDATFEAARLVCRGTDLQKELLFGPACARKLYYRVRAEAGSLHSPWSNTERVEVPAEDFKECVIAPELDAPVLQLTGNETGARSARLQWSSVPEATGYRLEVAGDPGFLTAQPFALAKADETGFLQRDLVPGTHFFRVRAEGSSGPGPWSNTVWKISVPVDWRVIEPERYLREVMPALVSIHRALLRCCATRGDVLGLLSFPNHFREGELLEYLSRLTFLAGEQRGGPPIADAGSEVPPLQFAEANNLGFAACYHPWVYAHPEEEPNPLLCPPDGVVGGLLGSIALERGAWIAPANAMLRGPVALEPPITRAGWEELYARQINVLEQDARGFVAMSAKTLSRRGELRPINVRRLLMLLRRLALREGNRWVFAPATPRFERTVKHAFEQMLSEMYARGAFAGDTPESAYKVLLPRALNTEESRALGRLVIELRVAPSVPMAFITIRLVQQGGRITLTTEV